MAMENKTKTIGLVGNQNAGKTTLFNALTGMNATVGNWPGVTIERKEGFIKGGKDLILVDTPGVYSLSPYTDEEKVTRKFCLESRPNIIINIIDATALERSLYLTTQLAELNADIIVALNMVDILEVNGITIDDQKLEEELGLTAIRISAKTGEGIEKLISTIRENKYRSNPHLKIYANDVQDEVDHIEGDLNTELEETHNPKFTAVKVFERDPFFKALDNTSTENEIKAIEKSYEMDSEQIVADQRYDFVTKVKNVCYVEKVMPESITDKLDKIFLNKWLSLPIFVAIMGLVYFLSVGLVGNLTTDFINGLFNGSESISIFGFEIPFVCQGLGPWIGSLITGGGGSVWSADLVQNGVIAGISAVTNFLPQLIVLFYCMAILEASGYMNRIAFFLDKIFQKFGLSGKSIIPFIVGSGCSVPGIMSARTIESEKERNTTIMLTPFIPCSAKLPIIALLSSIIWPAYGWLIALSVYMLAIVIILITAILIKRFSKTKEDTAFITELPAYKLPEQKDSWREVWDKSLTFIKRAGSIIFLCSLVLWLLTRFDWTWRYVGPTDLLASAANSGSLIDQSILAGIGRIIAFVFIPAWGGNYSWGLTVSAMQGLIAKEQVVSSLAIIAGTSARDISTSAAFGFFNASNGFAGGCAAYSFIVFNLFSAPCFGALAVMRKELGSAKNMMKALSIELAWSFSLSTLIGLIGWSSTGYSAKGINISEGWVSSGVSGSYVGIGWVDGAVLAVVFILVGLVVYFHFIKPRITHQPIGCEDEPNRGARLVKAYHKAKAKEEKEKANDQK
jgi:ferrous iron transport protein B